MSKAYKKATRSVHGGHSKNEYGAVVTPIWQSSVFAFDEANPDADIFDSQSENYVYSRLGNPTVRAFENAVADLESAFGGIATASGMAAVNTVLFGLTSKDSHILCSANVYGSTRAVIENDWKRFGSDFDFTDTSDIAALKRGIKKNTSIVYIETPSNPGLRITDIRKAAEAAHAAGALLVADNTFAGPIFQNPIKLGADIVLHSVTKYINGHSDVVGGIVLTANAELQKKIHHAMMYLGCNMDPHQAFLAHRGMKTLALRMRAAEKNAAKLAEYLVQNSKIQSVYYPGLKSHPGHKTAAAQMSGFSSVISFELLGGMQAGIKLLNSVQLIAPAVSLGGVETFIQHPASMTHSNISPEERRKAGITDGLLRMAVGIEHIDDLINDLDQAINASQTKTGYY